MDKRIKQLYYNKRNKSDWDFGSLDKFTTWYKEQINAQKNCCYYCGVNQDDITLLIKKGIIKSKRFNKRGRNLEVERREPDKYNKENCVLACYFCNNHKSDIINADEFKKHFETAQFEYIQYLKAKL